MVKIKMKPINVSNTTLSYYPRRHRKFDVNQRKKGDYGKTYCIECDELITKTWPTQELCPVGTDCRRLRVNRQANEWKKQNPKKVKISKQKHYKAHKAKILARAKRYRTENAEVIASRRQTPEYRKRRKELRSTPEAKAKAAAYDAQPERVAKRKEYDDVNREKRNIQRNKRSRERWKTDPSYREQRSRIAKAAYKRRRARGLPK